MSSPFDLHMASRLATDHLSGHEYEAGRRPTDCVNIDTVLNKISIIIRFVPCAQSLLADHCVRQ